MNTRIVFMGTPDFAVSSLQAIYDAGFDVAAVVTVPDRKVGRGQKISFSPVKQYAMEHNLTILQPSNLKDPEFVDTLQQLKAHIFVVVAFRMLPKVVWSIPPLGTFNLHASLLPQYRGAAPINWAIINGETTSGVTTFLLNERIDEGEILLQESTPILQEDNAGSLHDRLASIGAPLVVRTIEGLVNNSLSPHAQQPSKVGKPAPKIFKEDCAINWNIPGKDIVNFVRGLCPYPAATTSMIDKTGVKHLFKIYDVVYNPSSELIPAHLKTDEKNYIKVGCTDGYIEILSLQIEGKRRISAKEFLRGTSITNWKIA